MSVTEPPGVMKTGHGPADQNPAPDAGSEEAPVGTTLCPPEGKEEDA